MQGLPREKGSEPGLAGGTGEAGAPRSRGMRPRQSSGFRVLSPGNGSGAVPGYPQAQHLGPLQARDRGSALREGRDVSPPQGQRQGPVPGRRGGHRGSYPGGGGVSPEAGAGERPRAGEGVSLAAPGAPRLARGPPAARQRHAPHGTRYSPGPGRPVARGLPAGSPAPAPVGGSRTRAQVGGGGLIALTQDGGGGFAASHVVIKMLKRAVPWRWRAGSGPGRLSLRCRWSRRCHIRTPLPQERDALRRLNTHKNEPPRGCAQYTCAHNQHVRRRLPCRARCSRGTPPRRC